MKVNSPNTDGIVRAGPHKACVVTLQFILKITSWAWTNRSGNSESYDAITVWN